jgi:hypothetical protein
MSARFCVTEEILPDHLPAPDVVDTEVDGVAVPVTGTVVAHAARPNTPAPSDARSNRWFISRFYLVLKKGPQKQPVGPGSRRNQEQPKAKSQKPKANSK